MVKFCYFHVPHGERWEYNQSSRSPSFLMSECHVWCCSTNGTECFIHCLGDPAVISGCMYDCACTGVYVCIYIQEQKFSLCVLPWTVVTKKSYKPWASDGSFRFLDGEWSHLLSITLGEWCFMPCMAWLSKRQLFRWTCLGNFHRSPFSLGRVGEAGEDPFWDLLT